MHISVYDKFRPATEREKEYVKSLSSFAIDKTIVTDGVSLQWSEYGSKAQYSAQYAVKKGGSLENF